MAMRLRVPLLAGMVGAVCLVSLPNTAGVGRPIDRSKPLPTLGPAFATGTWDSRRRKSKRPMGRPR